MLLMRSKIADAIKLKNEPVAIFRLDEKPENGSGFKEGKPRCVIPILNAASKGHSAIYDEANAICMGAKSGLGFRRNQLGYMENFLSTGTENKEGERYKKTPELAANFITNLPEIKSQNYVVFRPLSALGDNEVPDIMVFLVNADQLSALVQFANYDKPTQDNVRVEFASGCQQSILLALVEAKSQSQKCVIGMTDPSARLYIDKNLLSFSIPYKRFLELESQVDGSFLTQKTWLQIKERI